MMSSHKANADFKAQQVTPSEPPTKKDLDNSSLRADIESAINRASRENASNTPDFILAEYLTAALEAFEAATAAREKWYGISLKPTA